MLKQLLNSCSDEGGGAWAPPVQVPENIILCSSDVGFVVTNTYKQMIQLNELGLNSLCTD